MEIEIHVVHYLVISTVMLFCGIYGFFTRKNLLASEGKIIAKGPTREVLSNPVLAEYGVAVPQVIDLFMKMQAAGKPMKTVPINLEEAIGQLCARREEMA